MNNIYDLEISELESVVVDLGYKPYRAAQVFGGLYKGLDLEEITVLPKELKSQLKDKYILKPVTIYKDFKAKDGTIKYLLKLSDDNLIECVFIKNNYGNTLCVSTQAGCGMGCAFCASGEGGLKRNLSAGEIAAQVICAAKASGGIKNIVLMGSGEPLSNFDNTVKFLKLISCRQGLNLLLRNISLSTCGIVPQIYNFAKLGMPVTLSLSLHSAFDEVRQKIMPIAKKYTVKQTIDAVRHYFEISGRRIIIEYTMIKDLNISQKDADKLKEVLSGLNCHINLIMLSPVENSGFLPCSKQQAEAFKDMLEKNKLSVTFRRQTGVDIEGSCGQLRRRHIILCQGESYE